MAPPVQRPKYRRRVSRVIFDDGLASHWTFGVPEAFKASLDIQAETRILSPRGVLLRELRQLGIFCPPAALDCSRPDVEEVVSDMRAAGLTVLSWSRGRDAAGVPRAELLVETQGEPPSFEFAPGDIFFEPREARALLWEEALLILRRSVQVQDFFDGQVKAEVREYQDGVFARRQEIECPVAEFVTLLRDGLLPVAAEPIAAMPELVA